MANNRYSRRGNDASFSTSTNEQGRDQRHTDHTAASFLDWLSNRDTSSQGDGFNFDLFKDFNPSFDGLDRPSASALSNDLQLKKAQFDSQVALMNWQTWYNSEAEKIKRMRAAGLNPDILGLDSASTASGSVDMDLGGETSDAIQSGAAIRQAAVAERQANLQAALAIPQLILQGVSVLSGVFSSMAQIGVSKATESLLKKQEDGAVLDNFNKARGVASNKVIDGISAAIGVRGTIDDLSDEKLREIIHEASSAITGDDSIDRLIRREMNSLEKNPAVARQYWDDYSNSLKLRQDAAETTAHPLYNEDFLVMSDSFKPLMKASYDTLKADLDRQLKENEYLMDYFSSSSGFLKAGAENAMNLYNSELYLNLDGKQAAETQNLANEEAYNALKYKQQFLEGFRDSMDDIYKRMQSENKWTRFAAQAEYNLLVGFLSAFGTVTGNTSSIIPIQ